MSAKIRLNRVGSKSKPYYRIVVIDESSARNGTSLEVLGHYDPRKEPASFEVNKEQAQLWLNKGAIPSDVVRKYFGKIGLMEPVNFDKKPKRKPKGEVAEQPAAEAAKPAA